jgi:hypothetical protein
VKQSNNKYSNDEANMCNVGKGTGVYKPAA